MQNHTCLLDHHQRSHNDTITIGPVGMMNWALQLNNSQSVNLFNSLLKKFNMLNSTNQPSSAPYPQEFNSLWKKTIEEPLHMSTAEKSDRPKRNQDLRCQSGPSAKDSVIFSGGDCSKN